jgi:hypothetical protein
MGSANVVPSGLVIVWVIILFFAPFIGTLIASLINLVINREIPPILPQINLQSFGQAFVAMVVLGLITQTTKTVFLLSDALVIVFLFIVLLAQAFIDKRQTEETRKHVRKVLKEKVEINLTEKIDLSPIYEVAESLIDVDYFPDSIANELSGRKRRDRRNQFINIFASCLENKGGMKISLSEKDFLVPNNEAAFLKNAYVIISGVSVFLYFVSILLSVLGQV